VDSIQRHPNYQSDQDVARGHYIREQEESGSDQSNAYSYPPPADGFDGFMSFILIAFLTSPIWLFVLGLGLFLVESGLQALQQALQSVGLF
jgi:hypothetical protein